MEVFVVEIGLEYQDKNKREFINKFVEETNKYVVMYRVNKDNMCLYKERLSKESIVVVLNDVKKEELSHWNEFLQKAVSVEANIYPVAMNREDRRPLPLVEKKQSFDIWEEQRKRNISGDNFRVIADIFSRKIISKATSDIYKEDGVLFLSHARRDGEDIIAKICKRCKQYNGEKSAFRDVIDIPMGESAQEKIEETLNEMDVFVFLHTEAVSESEWVKKEIQTAIIRQVPIVWIQIDGANPEDLDVRPANKPHLKYSAKDFESDEKIEEIVEEIFHKSFTAMMSKQEEIFYSIEALKELLGDGMSRISDGSFSYQISMKRKNQSYPERNIEHKVKFMGRTPLQEDMMEKTSKQNDNSVKEFDSHIILSDKIINRKQEENVVFENFEVYYDYWKNYKYEKKDHKNKEIVIAGAFPDYEPEYQSALTMAVMTFARRIVKAGYTLVFGSHPTFQEAFFKIGEEAGDSSKVKMFISKYFENEYREKREYFKEYTQLIEIDEVKIEDNGARQKSLSNLRRNLLNVDEKGNKIDCEREIACMVCLGGMCKENKEEEGVREEVRLAMENNIPVFLVGSVGGCSSKLAGEFRKKDWQGLNSAGKLNEQFQNERNYFMLVEKMLKILDETDKGMDNI